jgi:hypothetical protein
MNKHRVRWYFYRLRAYIWPWCNEPGCWSRSYVQHKGRRGNACPVHAMERIMSVLDDDEVCLRPTHADPKDSKDGAR